MPAPTPTLGIFKAAFDPTAHAVPDGARLCWCHIGHDQPHFLIALVEAGQERPRQTTNLSRKAIDLPTPGAAQLWGGTGQRAKRPLPLRAEIALFVDAHEWVPPQRHDLAVEPGRVQT